MPSHKKGVLNALKISFDSKGEEKSAIERPTYIFILLHNACIPKQTTYALLAQTK